jgi:hypothetical protein
MKDTIKRIFEKLACKHDWYIGAKVEMKEGSGVNILYICQKCGKMKKVYL